MTLKATEFMRRFLLHVLPPGMMKIRHYGFYANRDRAAKLELCRRLLNVKQPPTASLPDAPLAPANQPSVIAHNAPLKLCPQCGVGHLHVIELISPIYSDTS